MKERRAKYFVCSSKYFACETRNRATRAKYFEEHTKYFMRHLHHFFLIAGALILIIGALGAWRASRPVLNAEEKIGANLEALRTAVQNRQPRGITTWLADDFQYASFNRRELHSQLAGFFHGAREVDLDLSNVSIQVSGESATATGNFRASFRATPDGAIESRFGRWTMQWRKRDGVWKINKLENAENALP